MSIFVHISGFPTDIDTVKITEQNLFSHKSNFEMCMADLSAQGWLYGFGAAIQYGY